MRPYLVTLAAVWTLGAIGAFVYSHQQNIAAPILAAVLPAFLLEAGLYLAPGFPAVRRAFDAVGPKPLRAALLILGALAPYLLESALTGSFRPNQFLLLLALTALVSVWYTVLAPASLPDLLFLALMAAVFLSKSFAEIYIRPTPHLQIEILGRLMWIRLGIMALLSLRGLPGVGFGFLPTRREWQVGATQFLVFLPLGAALAYAVQFAHLRPTLPVWWKLALQIPATFLGFLWVVALSEELFFRGFLQPMLSRLLRNPTAGLVLTSAVFGGVHLGYRSFPNWRFALVAAAAGIFYGVSFERTQSVRASMVTHALVVTAWKSFFVS